MVGSLTFDVLRMCRCRTRWASVCDVCHRTALNANLHFSGRFPLRWCGRRSRSLLWTLRSLCDCFLKQLWKRRNSHFLTQSPSPKPSRWACFKGNFRPLASDIVTTITNDSSYVSFIPFLLPRLHLHEGSISSAVLVEVPMTESVLCVMLQHQLGWI